MKKKSSITNRIKKEIEKTALYYKNITTASNSWERLERLERLQRWNASNGSNKKIKKKLKKLLTM